jgi:hypothetical protein
MADTAQQIQTKLTAIKNSRDSGVLTTKHGDELLTFRSLEEMNAIIRELEGELADATGVKRKARIRYPRQCTKGF